MREDDFEPKSETSHRLERNTARKGIKRRKEFARRAKANINHKQERHSVTSLNDIGYM